MRSPGSSAELERRRLLAVRRVLDGYPIEEVADSLGVHRTTVSRWVAAFRARGTAGRGRGLPRPAPETDDHAREGRPPLAGRRPYRARLPHRVVDRREGRPDDRAGVRRAFDPRHLGGWLRGRGLTPRVPQRVPRERDPDEIREWLATDRPRIKKARRPGAHLALIDASGLLMAPLVRRTWAPRGQAPRLHQKSGRREKVSVAAPRPPGPVLRGPGQRLLRRLVLGGLPRGAGQGPGRARGRRAGRRWYASR